MPEDLGYEMLSELPERRNRLKNILKTTACLSLICAVLFSLATFAAADSAGGFSARAIIPENQVNRRQSYFDLRLKPEDKQIIQVEITNSRNEDLPVLVSLNAAATGQNGLILYTASDIRDESLKIAITDVASPLEQRVVVPASSSVLVNIDIEMPDEPIEGTILGGIVIEAERPQAETASESAQTGVALQNIITYVLGLKITESDVEAEPDFDLTSVTPRLENRRTAIAVTLHNKSPRIVKDMAVTAQIFHANSDTPVNALTLSDAEMAPLSKGEFLIDWNGQPVDRGSYRLKMTAEYDGKVWEWTKDFDVTREESDNLNNGAVGLQKDYSRVYLALGIFGFLLTAIFAFLLGRSRRKTEA